MSSSGNVSGRLVTTGFSDSVFAGSGTADPSKYWTAVTDIMHDKSSWY